MSGCLLSLPATASWSEERGLLVLRHRWGETALGPGGAPLTAALGALAHGPAAPEQLDAAVREAASGRGLAHQPQLALLRHALERLDHTLHRHVRADGRPFATAVPLAPEAAVSRPGPRPAGAPLTLAGAAHCRPLEGALVLEAPGVRFRVRLDDPRAAALLVPLAGPADPGTLRRAVPGLPPEDLDALLDLLLRTGFLRVAEGADPAAGALPPGWSFHELLAYDGCRAGPRDRVYGPVFPLRATEPPPPPVAPLPPGPVIALHRPDPAETGREEPTFTEVLEARTSRRAYGDDPMTARQLGEFLHRAARVRDVLGARPEDDRPYDVTGRPYPSAGSAYELELRLAVRRCAGVEPGLYHYDPLGHRLAALPGDDAAFAALLREAAAATGGAPPPDVHLTLVSRYKRLSWKYAAHAYALTLKNAGVLTQTLYLVATAMGLSGCALGGGDSDTPVLAFGLDPATEIPVGGFLLGSAPDGPVP